MKTLYCDGGSEYIACDGYLADDGIERTHLPPYSPDLNGIGERANRTLMESACSMMYLADMPVRF